MDVTESIVKTRDVGSITKVRGTWIEEYLGRVS